MDFYAMVDHVVALLLRRLCVFAGLSSCSTVRDGSITAVLSSHSPVPYLIYGLLIRARDRKYRAPYR